MTSSLEVGVGDQSSSPHDFILGITNANQADELAEYIRERIDNLQDGANIFQIHSAGDRYTTQFLRSETRIKASSISKGFRVDDPEAYQEYAEDLLEVIRQQPHYDDGAKILTAVQLTCEKYFGSPLTDEKERLRTRDRWLGGLVRGKVQSLNSAKDGGFALCVERAALAHNLLLLSGVPSTFVYGQLISQHDGSIKRSGHAYLVVDFGNQTYIFDPTNPTRFVNGRSQYITPNCFVIDKDEWLAGSTHTVDVDDANTGQSSGTLSYKFSAAHPPRFEEHSALNYGERIAAQVSAAHERTMDQLMDRFSAFMIYASSDRPGSF